MTLSFRNGLLTLLLVLAGVAGVFLTYSAFIAGSDFGWKSTFPAQEAVSFWFLRRPATEIPLAPLLWQLLVLLPLVFVSLFYLRLLYRKTNSPELFFLSFFVFSLMGEGLRVLQLFYLLNDQSFFWSLVLTRVVWIFRLFGLFMAFSASLFGLEFTYQKLGNFVGMSLGRHNSYVASSKNVVVIGAVSKVLVIRDALLSRRPIETFLRSMTNGAILGVDILADRH